MDQAAYATSALISVASQITPLVSGNVLCINWSYLVYVCVFHPFFSDFTSCKMHPLHTFS